jgi:hypothetical protein
MANRLDALTVREKDGKSYWTRIGVAFPGNDGSYIVRLDAVPASTDGQYVIHLREPRDNGTQGGGQRQSRQRDDDVPGF